jgi:hypothetical protein
MRSDDAKLDPWRQAAANLHRPEDVRRHRREWLRVVVPSVLILLAFAAVVAVVGGRFWPSL